MAFTLEECGLEYLIPFLYGKAQQYGELLERERQKGNDDPKNHPDVKKMKKEMEEAEKVVNRKLKELRDQRNAALELIEKTLDILNKSCG